MVIFWGAKCFLKVQKTARQRKFLSENRDENAGKKKPALEPDSEVVGDVGFEPTAPTSLR